jgi:hypothetical protein
LSIDSRREEAEHRDRKKITRKNVDDLARARIEEGLNQPICNKSKGFLLLSKMGYKPGMSLGVNRNGDEGIKDPISIDLRNGRAGIGKNTIPKNPSNFSDTVPKQSEV